MTQKSHSVLVGNTNFPKQNYSERGAESGQRGWALERMWEKPNHV